MQAPTDPGPRAERAVAAEREQEQHRAECHQDGGVLTGACALDQQQTAEQELDQLVDPERDPTDAGAAGWSCAPAIGPAYGPGRRVAGSLRGVMGPRLRSGRATCPRASSPRRSTSWPGAASRRRGPANWAAAPDAPAVHDAARLAHQRRARRCGRGASPAARGAPGCAPATGS